MNMNLLLSLLLITSINSYEEATQKITQIIKDKEKAKQKAIVTMKRVLDVADEVHNQSGNLGRDPQGKYAFRKSLTQALTKLVRDISKDGSCRDHKTAIKHLKTRYRFNAASRIDLIAQMGQSFLKCKDKSRL